MDRLSIEVQVAHYPPYSSKYTPIEDRVFPHVSRACQGLVFGSVELVRSVIERVGSRAEQCASAEVQE